MACSPASWPPWDPTFPSIPGPSGYRGATGTGRGGWYCRRAGWTTPTTPPETEEFLVRQVATTSSYVFVPNSSDNSQTVARIDGRDFGVVPLRVGLRPTIVRAAEVEGQGAIAYVLCEGDSTLAIIRADELAADGKTRFWAAVYAAPRN